MSWNDGVLDRNKRKLQTRKRFPFRKRAQGGIFARVGRIKRHLSGVGKGRMATTFQLVPLLHRRVFPFLLFCSLISYFRTQRENHLYEQPAALTLAFPHWATQPGIWSHPTISKCPQCKNLLKNQTHVATHLRWQRLCSWFGFKPGWGGCWGHNWRIFSFFLPFLSLWIWNKSYSFECPLLITLSVNFVQMRRTMWLWSMWKQKRLYRVMFGSHSVIYGDI